jgi:putative membrane protein insertion efficiency factor
MTGARPGPLTRVLLALVAGYRALPRSGVPRCRFAPTCSSYAHGALLLHGAARGSILAVRRLLRCHPFHSGGVDHVPSPSHLSRQGVGS